MKRWTDRIRRSSFPSNNEPTAPEVNDQPSIEVPEGPKLGKRNSITKKEHKNLRKNAKNLNISIVAMSDHEVQIPNIFSWTKSYIPNKIYKTI